MKYSHFRLHALLSFVYESVSTCRLDFISFSMPIHFVVVVFGTAATGMAFLAAVVPGPVTQVYIYTVVVQVDPQQR